MDVIVKILFLFMISDHVLSLRLDVNPIKIETGLSKSLLVNCSLSNGSVPNFNGLTSLILARTVTTEENRHSTLASINAITGQLQVYTHNAVGNGTIDNKGDSYISLQWQYPMDDMAGEYFCEANGLDVAWRSTTVIEKISVNAANLNLHLLRDRLRSLLMSRNDLQSKVDIMQSTVDIMQSRTEASKLLFHNLQSTVDKLQSRLEDSIMWYHNLKSKVDIMQSRTEASKLWYFKRSGVYKGRRYYLSQQDPIARSEQSMATCVQYGGYLAEIDDWEEMNFIKAFIKTMKGFRLVLIGGTDEAQEEVWKYRHSNIKVPGFLLRSRKCGRACNCLFLYDAVDWLAIDDHCYYTNSHSPTRFLCEIP